MLKKFSVVSLLMVLFVLVANASTEPQPRKFVYANKPTSNLINVEVYEFIIQPPILQIKLWSDYPENVWWKARVRVHMYFCGATGHWEGTRPFRYYVAEWGWGYRTYDADMPPGETYSYINWGIQEGEAFDGNFTVVSWLPE